MALDSPHLALAAAFLYLASVASLFFEAEFPAKCSPSCFTSLSEIRAEATKEEDAMASLDALLSADLQAETDALSQYKAPILAQQV